MTKKLITLLLGFIILTNLIHTTAYAAPSPDPWIQNKSMWCWASAVKMVALNYHPFMLPADYKPYNQQNGIRQQYSAYDEATQKYTVDPVQEYIVHTFATKEIQQSGHDNVGGNGKNKMTALSALTGAEVNSFGDWQRNLFKSNSIRQKYIDEQLENNKWVIADAFSLSRKAHSYVITNKNPDNSYTMYDPWSGKYLTKSSSEWFEHGFKAEALNNENAIVTMVIYFES
jgi:hypothetical protein